MVKKFCKIKMNGKKGEVQKCVHVKNRKEAIKKLKDVEGKLVQF